MKRKAARLRETKPQPTSSSLERKVHGLLRRLDLDAPESVSESAGEAIRTMGEKILPCLVAEFGISVKRSQRAARAFWALGVAAKSAIPELERTLAKDPQFVAYALAGIGAAALPVLAKGIKHRSAPVRGGSAAAVSEVASKQRVPQDALEVLVPLLLQRLQDPFPYVRRDAVSALGSIRATPELCVPILLRMLNDPTDIVGIASAIALGKFGDDAREAIPALLEMAKSEDRQMRFFAIRSMASMGMGWPSEDRVVSCILERVRAPDLSVRGEAAACLGPKCKNANLAIPALIEFLRESANEPIRWQAIYSLQAWGELAKEAVPVLLEFLKEEPPKTWPDMVKEAVKRIDPEIDPNQVMPRQSLPAQEGASPQRGVARKLKYGRAKANTDISLQDLLKHPIWLWCLALGLPNEDDGPSEGDETWMRPLLNSTNVTADMCQPLILLRVKGTALRASGLYDHDKGTLDSVSVYVAGEATQPRFADGLMAPVTYVAVPAIEGQTEVEFQSDPDDSSRATLRKDFPAKGGGSRNSTAKR